MLHKFIPKFCLILLAIYEMHTSEMNSEQYLHFHDVSQIRNVRQREI